jgi:hypothetical protein
MKCTTLVIDSSTSIDNIFSSISTECITRTTAPESNHIGVAPSLILRANVTYRWQLPWIERRQAANGGGKELTLAVPTSDT